MKRITNLIFIVIMALMLSACGSSEPSAEASKCDVDLTLLSSTMVYSEVYNMMVDPDSYIGKTVKMSGSFSAFEGGPKERYYFCVISDATACCSQGIEFELKGDYSYPEDYPEIDSEITVIGTFETYDEYGELFCQLSDAVLCE